LFYKQFLNHHFTLFKSLNMNIFYIAGQRLVLCYNAKSFVQKEKLNKFLKRFLRALLINNNDP
jgi:hypothetical protein